LTHLLDPIVVPQRTLPARPEPNPAGPVTMLICHGMGQQTPFETLDNVVRSLTTKHQSIGGSVDVALRFVQFAGTIKSVPRAEITLRTEGRADVQVHLYEAYWAPLTEGVITYFQTAVFLIKSGLSGLRASLKGKFDRWMFGDRRWLPVDKSTTMMLVALLVVLLPLLAAAGAMGWIGYLFKQSFTSDFSFFGILSKLPHLIGLGLLVGLLWKFRGFLLQYIGDVAIYVSSHEVNRFWTIRHEIKQTGINLAQSVYRAVSEAAPVQRLAYSRVVFAGHSLGSVVAYDTLNAMIQEDQLGTNSLAVLDRTYALVTFGSPLDKIAFLFRQKTKNGIAREALAAGVQPMIQNYALRPQWWINIFCRRDVVSGALEYFDHPEDLHHRHRVRNFEDSHQGWNPVAAHTEYWDRQPTIDLLYLAAMGDLQQLESKAVSCVEQSKRAIEQYE
jgi:hypothetical protein